MSIKYKVNDRILLTDADYNFEFIIGQECTIISMGKKKIHIRIDIYSDDLHNCYHRCDNGHGYYAKLSQIKLIKGNWLNRI